MLIPVWHRPAGPCEIVNHKALPGPGDHNSFVICIANWEIGRHIDTTSVTTYKTL